jgi:glycosyltransferase involved in cell wall biosynthesis
MLISIVIPAYNEQENIGQCLNALMNQSFGREKYEIILFYLPMPTVFRKITGSAK